MRDKDKKIRDKFRLAGLIFFLSFIFHPFAFTYADTCDNALKTGVYPCSVTLNWTDNSDNEATFIIERQLNGGPWSQLSTVTPNVTTAIDATPTQDPAVDNNYCYRVIAANVDAAGKPQQSAPSNIACKVIPKKPVAIPPPTAPSGLSTAAVSQTMIRLSWSDNSDNETGFEIERWTSAPAVTTVVFTTPANVPNWDNTGLTRNRSYCYRVKAKNSAGDSPYSNESCATTNR